MTFAYLSNTCHREAGAVATLPVSSCVLRSRGRELVQKIFWSLNRISLIRIRSLKSSDHNILDHHASCSLLALLTPNDLLVMTSSGASVELTRFAR